MIEIVTVLNNQYELNAAKYYSRLHWEIEYTKFWLVLFLSKAQEFCTYCTYWTHPYGPTDMIPSNTDNICMIMKFDYL